MSAYASIQRRMPSLLGPGGTAGNSPPPDASAYTACRAFQATAPPMCCRRLHTDRLKESWCQWVSVHGSSQHARPSAKQA